MKLESTAVGPCIICGKESKGSNYWVGMSMSNWQKLRPHFGKLVELWGPKMPARDRAMINIAFVPNLCKPLCGAECSLKLKEINDGVHNTEIRN
jgi:hypothetical protein